MNKQLETKNHQLKTIKTMNPYVTYEEIESIAKALK